MVDGIPDAFECGLALYKHKLTGGFSTSILVARVWYISTKRKQRLWEAGAATTSLNKVMETGGKTTDCPEYSPPLKQSANRQSESPGGSCSIPTPVLNWKTLMQKTWKTWKWDMETDLWPSQDSQPLMLQDGFH